MLCEKCKGKGYVERGDKELPCDQCPAGDEARFTIGGVDGEFNGAYVKKHFLQDSPEPLMHGWGNEQIRAVKPSSAVDPDMPFRREHD